VKRNYINGSRPELPDTGGGCLHGSDSELLARAQAGDDSAFHELIERHSASLFRLGFLLVGNVADAEDVVQETLLGAFQHLVRFKGHSSVKTWLTRILVKQAARHHRSRFRRRTISLEETGGKPGEAGEASALDTQIQSADARMDVRAVLEALSAEHRQVVVLREYEGMSYREISEVLNMPPGTVESRLFRAREHLKRLLKAYE